MPACYRLFASAVFVLHRAKPVFNRLFAYRQGLVEVEPTSHEIVFEGRPIRPNACHLAWRELQEQGRGHPLHTDLAKSLFDAR